MTKPERQALLQFVRIVEFNLTHLVNKDSEGRMEIHSACDDLVNAIKAATSDAGKEAPDA